MSTHAHIVPYDPEKPATADAARLWATAYRAEKAPKVGTARTFYGAGPDGGHAVVSALGAGFAKEGADARKERVRKAVGAAVKSVKGLEDLSKLTIDAAGEPQAAAAAAHLALYKFSLKTSPPSPFAPGGAVPVPEKVEIVPSEASEEWARGVVIARAQNLARTLMELPANLMTPTAFTERVQKEFAGLDNVEIIARDASWAESKGMNAFLSVTHGSAQPAKFLEIHYKGAPSKDAQPLALVGKGITFDTGGISLKPRVGMQDMRADMGGAAVVVATTLAAAQLKLPINLVVTTPLTENMPGGRATKPGDIVYAMNGKSIQIDNTDAEGRLVLSDAIYYTATEYKPHTLIDVATLTGAMGYALGEVFTGVFSSSDDLWEQLRAAGEVEYDRFWRMPLEEDFGPQIYSTNADLCNTGGSQAGSCTAALFLKAFAPGIEADGDTPPSLRWAHVDIAGVMEHTRATPYMEKGMSGRPVRPLVEFLRRISQQ
ncbi:cytosol aminopeptidase family, catalytic domain-containing protein [Schizophyllum fasciatum]